MRNLLLFALLLCATLFSSTTIKAQAGWKWGVVSYYPSAVYNKGYDAQQTVIDPSGNIITAGYGWGDTMVFGIDTLFNLTAAQPMIIIKTDSTGHFLWEKMTLHSNVDAQGLAVDTAGNIYVMGNYDSASVTVGTYTLTNTVYPKNISYIAKYSPSGTVLWATNVAQGYAHPTSLGIDAAQNVYVIGAYDNHTITIGTTTLTNIGTIFSDVYVAKFDKLGNPVWATSFGGIKMDYPNCISVASDGTLCVAGAFYSGALTIGTGTLPNSLTPNPSGFIVSFDANGNLKWAKETPHLYANQMQNFAATGNTYFTGVIDTNTRFGPDSLTTMGGQDAVVGGFDSVGNFKWARSAGGHTTDQGFGMAIDNCGKIFACGQMGTNPATGYSMNFSGHTLSEPAGANEPMFIAEYDTAGTYIMSLALVSGGDDISRVVVDNKGSFYVAGDLVHSMTFGSSVLLASGIEAFFEAKYKYDSLVCVGYSVPTLQTATVHAGSADISLYPNPATNECTIATDTQFPVGSTAELYDLSGRLINTYILSGSSTGISLTNLSSGMYLCRINTGDGSTVVKKLIVSN